MGKLSLYRGESAFTTWLHRLAVNVVLNARKSEGRNRPRFRLGARRGGYPPARAGERLDARDGARSRRGDRRTSAGGLDRCSFLHDVEGYKHEEIAEMLGITSGGSKAQLHARGFLLREALNR